MSENAGKWRMRSVVLAGRLSANEHPCARYSHSRSFRRLISIPGVLDTSDACSAPSVTRLRLYVTWLQVCNLGAISPGHPKGISHLEIAPRLRTCSQVT